MPSIRRGQDARDTETIAKRALDPPEADHPEHRFLPDITVQRLSNLQ